MRPRAGDFLYTPEELEMLRLQILQLKAAGADGFVIGCLTAAGDLDMDAMKPLVDACGGCGITLHRCIDVSRDPVRTYLDAGKLDIDTVLTSGGAGSCLAGMETIGNMLRLDGPQVLIGAGVKAAVIQKFLDTFPEADAFHMSGKCEIESGMTFRREGVPMGLPGLDEWHIQQTSEDAVRKAREVLYK
jgi:copper homeostasis protein